jgi:hypothetical protein
MVMKIKYIKICVQIDQYLAFFQIHNLLDKLSII